MLWLIAEKVEPLPLGANKSHPACMSNEDGGDDTLV